jgi:hypothetical protein
VRRRSPGVLVATEKGLIAHGNLIATAGVTLEQDRQVQGYENYVW